ncbi:hypothetical protein PCE1_001021 [Barthelona sp. PCE]
MPRSIHNVSQNFTVCNYSDKFIFSSTIESRNNKKICLMEKHDKLIIHGPIDEAALQSSERKFSQLKPTLLNPKFFYRSICISDARSVIELFEFINGEFVFIDRHELNLQHKKGCMLTERFLVNQKKIGRNQSSIDIFDLGNDNKLVFYVDYDYVLFKYFVHQDLPYLMVMGDPHSVIWMEVFSFTDEGVPFLTDDHALVGIRYFALNVTPGKSHIILQHGKKIHTVSAEEGNNISTTTLDYKCPKFSSHHKEIAHVLNVCVPHPSAQKYDSDVLCEEWDFVSLEGDIYCTEYDQKSGSTRFFQMCKHLVKCMFILEDDSLRLFTGIIDSVERLKKYPIIPNLFDGSVILLKNSGSFHKHRIHKVHRFYSIGDQKWHIGFLTIYKTNCFFYVDNEQVAKFRLRRNAEIDAISASDIHYSVSYERGYSVDVNANALDANLIENLRLVGNYAWYMENRHALTLLMLSEETGEITRKMQHSFDGSATVSANPYCPYECIVFQFNSAMVVRCDPDKDEDAFCFHEIKFEPEAYHCFLDEGLLVYHDKVYEFNSLAIINDRNVPVFRGNLISPKNGVAMWMTPVEKFNVEIYTLTVSDDECDISSESLNVIDFLTECEITSFSSFQLFGSQ